MTADSAGSTTASLVVLVAGATAIVNLLTAGGNYVVNRRGNPQVKQIIDTVKDSIKENRKVADMLNTRFAESQDLMSKLIDKLGKA